jgi:hypothetical protein
MLNRTQTQGVQRAPWAWWEILVIPLQIAMKQFSRFGLFVGLIASILALTGCGGTTNPIVPVTGKIALASGKKLPAGTRLLFEPVEGRVGTAMGVVAEDGSFQMTHVKGGTGAEEGKYVVKLLPPESGSPEFSKVVPKKCQEEAFGTAEIKAGMAPLELKVPALQ